MMLKGDFHNENKQHNAHVSKVLHVNSDRTPLQERPPSCRGTHGGHCTAHADNVQPGIHMVLGLRHSLFV